MPELPEVAALAQFLTRQATGLAVTRVDVAAISALKTFDPPISGLVGRTVRGASSRGKFLVVSFDGAHLVTHLARAGWLHWRDQLAPGPTRPGKGPLALRVHLEGDTGWDLTEAGTRKSLSVYVVPDPADVPGIARLGPDPLAETFDLATLTAILRGQRKQIKGLITDQSVIAGIGNAYSDEILHVARLSPFALAANLTDEETLRLYTAIRDVLADAVERCLGQGAATLKAEKRSGLRVHGRTGEPCPVCGDEVREVSFATSSLQYCPTCQTGGKPLADRRLSKFGITQ
ncbi:MAG TPA: DNA-formamidopyrimidine glycosylase family protein [Actinocrinis sp.]|nr:DNA-formamidopyrimidine glycosylase family protein [Actinocrinis sp.]